MNVTMVNLHDAKTHLSAYARKVKRGQRIILCDRNRPFAEIRPLSLTPAGRRPFGLAKGKFDLPASFNLPDADIEALFGGAGRG